MPRWFRVFVFPWFVAGFLIVFSLDPVRFFRDGRCLFAFFSLAIGLAFENSLVSPQSVAESAKREQAKHDRHSFELSALCNLFCFYLPVYDYFHLPEIIPRSTPVLIAGIALFELGGLVRILAIRTLGRFFTMRVAVLGDHQVVRDGFYRFVRHPAYTGWFLLSVGMALVFSSIVGVLGTVVFVLVLAWRVKVEEEALRTQLGEAYAKYMLEVSSRFIPGIF